MTQVRTFCLKSKDLGLIEAYFFIDQIPFREGLGRMINLFEEELGLSHKTCQCLPVFVTTGYKRIVEGDWRLGLCKEVYVILTF